MDGVMLLLVAYLIGSLPTAQIVAHLLAGVDLRERAPTVSGSGVYYAVARWAVVPVGLVDVTKGGVATYLPTSSVEAPASLWRVGWRRWSGTTGRSGSVSAAVGD